MGKELEECDDIPGEDNVARYCRPKNIRDGKVSSAEFELRKNESYLSVNWLEYFKDETDMESKLLSVCKGFKNSFNISEKGLFALINVGEAKSRISGLLIKHIPEECNPSHAGIASGKEDENRELTLELSSIVGENVFSVPKNC